MAAVTVDWDPLQPHRKIKVLLKSPISNINDGTKSNKESIINTAVKASQKIVFFDHN
jgi:hypothetical protein